MEMILICASAMYEFSPQSSTDINEQELGGTFVKCTPNIKTLRTTNPGPTNPLQFVISESSPS